MPVAAEVSFQIELADGHDRHHCEVPKGHDKEQRNRFERACVYGLCRVEQIAHRDDADQRSRLEKIYRLVSSRRDDHPHRLGKDDSPQR